MKRLICILLLAIVSIAGCKSENLDEIMMTGLQKSDVKQMLGEPDKIEELTKHTEHVFGPVESLWYQMQMGDKIVIWIYETRTGRKELYFLNDAPEVADEFFWYNDSRKNPVY